MRLKHFAKAGHLPTLFSAFLYFDVSFMVWMLLGPLAVFISEDFHLTPAQKGLLVAYPVLSGALLRLILGPLADRAGAKKTALLGLALTLAVLLWGFLGANSLSELHLLGCLLGVAGASFAVALPMASRWYPPQYQGLAMGIAGAGNSGTVLTALFAPPLARHFGDWHVVFALAMIPVAITWITVALLAKESPNRAAPKKAGEYFTLLKEPDTLWFCLFYSVTFGGFVGLASFLPTFFVDQYHLDKVRAGQFTALCVFAGSFLRPFGGYLADRFGGIRMLTVLYLVLCGFLFFAAQLPSLSLLLPLLFVVMALLGSGNGSVFQLVPQRFRKQIGVITGIVGAAGGIGGFFVPSTFGFLKQSVGSYGIGFALFAVVSLICSGLILLLNPVWQKAGWLAAGGKAVVDTPVSAIQTISEEIFAESKS